MTSRVIAVRQLLLFLGVIPFLSLIAAAPAAADKRIALVIGNSAYQNVARLDNPRNDAKLMADTLRGLGFTLVGGNAQIDLDKTSLDNAVQSFGSLIQGADVGLFYYAGHGVQVSGANYLVPVGANPTKEADVDFQMVDVNLVLRQMQGAGTKLNLVILDACRNNPFGGRGLRATGGGLAQMRAPSGTLISYATQPGNVAQDGTDGNSPFTKALTQTMRRPGLDILQTFNQIGLAVQHSTGGSQEPWMSSSPIDGSFYFSGAPNLPSENPGPASDETAWSFLKDTNDLQTLQKFLSSFPNSQFRAEVETKISALQSQQKAIIPVAPQSPPENLRQRVAFTALKTTPTLLSKFGNWGAYVIVRNGERECYSFARGKNGNGDQVALTISNRPKDKTWNEFSLLELPFRDGAKLSILVNSVSFPLIVLDRAAYTQNPYDTELVAAMISAAQATVTGSGARGKDISIDFPLSGFPAALERSTWECQTD